MILVIHGNGVLLASSDSAELILDKKRSEVLVVVKDDTFRYPLYVDSHQKVADRIKNAVLGGVGNRLMIDISDCHIAD